MRRIILCCSLTRPALSAIMPICRASRFLLHVPIYMRYHNKSAVYPKQNISPFPALPLDIYRNMLLNTVCIFREVYLKQSCFRRTGVNVRHNYRKGNDKIFQDDVL